MCMGRGESVARFAPCNCCWLISMAVDAVAVVVVVVPDDPGVLGLHSLIVWAQSGPRANEPREEGDDASRTHERQQRQQQQQQHCYYRTPPPPHFAPRAPCSVCVRVCVVSSRTKILPGAASAAASYSLITIGRMNGFSSFLEREVVFSEMTQN